MAPEPNRGADAPVLTGVYGFPWRGPELDAKCTLRDWDQGTLGIQARQLERHHPVIPDPSCTCGIYALSAEAIDTNRARLPRGRPVVSGFVELSGRLIRRGAQVRARHARVVGPLALSPGRIPLIAHLFHALGSAPRPRRVRAHPFGYRVLWSGKGAGIPFGEWEEQTRVQLEARYGVRVVALR